MSPAPAPSAPRRPAVPPLNGAAPPARRAPVRARARAGAPTNPRTPAARPEGMYHLLSMYARAPICARALTRESCARPAVAFEHSTLTHSPCSCAQTPALAAARPPARPRAPAPPPAASPRPHRRAPACARLPHVALRRLPHRLLTPDLIRPPRGSEVATLPVARPPSSRASSSALPHLQVCCAETRVVRLPTALS